MRDVPDALAILATLTEELRAGIAPGFAQRVAANAVALTLREIRYANANEANEHRRIDDMLRIRHATLEAANAALCALIRRDSLAVDDPGLIAHLRATASDKLAIDQPTYPPFRAVPDQGERTREL